MVTLVTLSAISYAIVRLLPGYFFIAVFSLVILQRLGELVLARRNAAHIKSLGGYEVGAGHYPLIVLLHVSFLASLFLEMYERDRLHLAPYAVPFALFLLAQALRVWCLASLGRFWNTRIYVVPHSDPVMSGPYHYLRHPNYVVVATEILTLPLAFGAPWTALLFTVLNAGLLRVRIQTEEQALAKVTPYAEQMGPRARFFPSWKK